MARPIAVFDWNGTLLDDMDAWVKGCNASLSQFGQAERTLDEWRELYTCPIIHSYEKAGVSLDEYLSKFDEANEAFYQAYQSAISSGLRLRKYAEQALDWVRDNDYYCIVLSNHRFDFLRDEIAKTGVLDRFDHVCGNLNDQDIMHKLTKKERLKAYMDELDLDLERSFIIGDSHEEPYVGRSVGVKTISIRGGYLSDERLRAAEPNYLISELDEISQYMENSAV